MLGSLVDWNMREVLQKVRTLVPEEGGGLYRVRQTPPALSYTGFKVHKEGALLVTPVINIHE